MHVVRFSLKCAKPQENDQPFFWLYIGADPKITFPHQKKGVFLFLFGGGGDLAGFEDLNLGWRYVMKGDGTTRISLVLL